MVDEEKSFYSEFLISIWDSIQQITFESVRFRWISMNESHRYDIHMDSESNKQLQNETMLTKQNQLMNKSLESIGNMSEEEHELLNKRNDLKTTIVNKFACFSMRKYLWIDLFDVNKQYK